MSEVSLGNPHQKGTSRRGGLGSFPSIPFGSLRRVSTRMVKAWLGPAKTTFVREAKGVLTSDWSGQPSNS